MTMLLFLLGVAVLIKAGTRETWQGQAQGYRPPRTLSFWSVLGRIMGFAFGFTVLVLISLMWLAELLGRHST